MQKKRNKHLSVRSHKYEMQLIATVFVYQPVTQFISLMSKGPGMGKRKGEEERMYDRKPK